MYDFLLIVNRDHSCKLLSFFRRLLFFHFGDRQTNGQTDGHHRCVKPQSYYGELQLNNVVFLALKLTWRFGICYGVAACSQSVLKQAWSFIVSTFTFSVLLPRLSLPWRICILAAISSLDRCVVGSQEIASDLDVLCIPVTEHLQLIETRLERWLNCLVSLEHYIIRRNDEKSHDASRTLGADQVQGIQGCYGCYSSGAHSFAKCENYVIVHSLRRYSVRGTGWYPCFEVELFNAAHASCWRTCYLLTGVTHVSK